MQRIQRFTDSRIQDLTRKMRTLFFFWCRHREPPLVHGRLLEATGFGRLEAHLAWLADDASRQRWAPQAAVPNRDNVGVSFIGCIGARSGWAAEVRPLQGKKLELHVVQKCIRHACRQWHQGTHDHGLSRRCWALKRTPTTERLKRHTTNWRLSTIQIRVQNAKRVKKAASARKQIASS